MQLGGDIGPGNPLDEREGDRSQGVDQHTQAENPHDPATLPGEIGPEPMQKDEGRRGSNHEENGSQDQEDAA